MWYDAPRVHILLDYRPALRQRTGAGEYAHNLAGALQASLGPADKLTLFSSSWKDRLSPGTLRGAAQVDARVPVSVLNFAWHRLDWPPVELFAGRVDVAQSMHPLRVPSRNAVQFITIHDLYFLDHRDHTSAEIQRDYGSMVQRHAQEADGVVVSASHTRELVHQRLSVDLERIVVCPPGAPDWPPRTAPVAEGPILFIGSLEPRKNVGGLLKAYAQLVGLRDHVPDLVLAGRAAAGMDGVLAALSVPPLVNRVRALGYISDEERQRLYREASMLVLPSFDEGFGLPALEAMTVGVPVIVSRRGSLPEVVADAGLFVDPDDAGSIAHAMKLVLDDPALRGRLSEAGRRRAADFTWPGSVERLCDAYRSAIERRRQS